MVSVGKSLIGFGLLIAALGVLIILASKIPHLGRLPGDLYVQRKNFTFYFPLATSILVSVVLSLIFAFLRRHR